MAEEELDDLVLALGGGLVQRGELPQVGDVDRGAVLHQKLRHLVVPVGTGVVERDQPALVLGMDICRPGEQELHDPDPVVAGRKV